MGYYISKTVESDFDKVVEKTTNALSEQGFGIITEINVHNTFKEKLDIEFKKYKILGACNPNFAYEAVKNEDKFGVMLPCNVLVIDQGNGKIEVATIDPISLTKAVPGETMEKFASDVKERLNKAIENIE